MIEAPNQPWCARITQQCTNWIHKQAPGVLTFMDLVCHSKETPHGETRWRLWKSDHESLQPQSQPGLTKPGQDPIGIRIAITIVPSKQCV
jgi:hypothetical protein